MPSTLRRPLHQIRSKSLLLERRAIGAGRSIGAKLHSHIIKNLQNGYVPSVGDMYAKQLHPIMSKLMLVSHLHGYADTMRTVGRDKRVLQLSIFDTSINSLAKVYKLPDIDLLEHKYNLESAAALQTLATKLDAGVKDQVQEAFSSG